MTRPLALTGLAVTALLTGCAATGPRETYMVMPEDGGRVGKLHVSLRDGSEEQLEGAYSSLALTGGRKTRYTGDDAELRRVYGSAVDALPVAPLSVMLLFRRDTDELTPDSRTAIEKAHRQYVERGAPEIWIIGHTDTVGSDAYNDALSLRRAESARQALLKLGVPGAKILAKGRGKRDLLVRTPENTSERLNRRVEINVR